MLYIYIYTHTHTHIRNIQQQQQHVSIQLHSTIQQQQKCNVVQSHSDRWFCLYLCGRCVGALLLWKGLNSGRPQIWAGPATFMSKKRHPTLFFFLHGVFAPF